MPLYALSNWSAETFPHALARFPFLQWFRGTVISGAVRIRKPDDGIYRHLFDETAYPGGWRAPGRTGVFGVRAAF